MGQGCRIFFILAGELLTALFGVCLLPLLLLQGALVLLLFHLLIHWLDVLQLLLLLVGGGDLGLVPDQLFLV